MKFKFVNIFLTACFVMNAACLNAAYGANGIIAELEALQQKGLSREKERIFDTALVAYKVILTKSQPYLNGKNLDLNLIEKIIPYTIAAAYRKGIVTHRSIEGSVVKLHAQFELYEEAQKWINETLTLLSNVENTYGIKPSEKQRAFLYFARAYNKSGWTFALLKGSLWKRYLVYPPADGMKMMDEVIADLKQALAYSDYETLPTQDLALTPEESKTWELCLGVSQKDALLGTAKAILENSAQKTIDLYANGSVAPGIKLGRGIFTYEELKAPSSAPVFASLDQLLAAIEVK
jgi:hypothetical protein